LLPEITTAVPPEAGPLPGATLEIVGEGAGATLIEKLAEQWEAWASCTSIVKGKLPASVGVPLIVPVKPFN
jgi:hypothetical protein